MAVGSDISSSPLRSLTAMVEYVGDDETVRNIRVSDGQSNLHAPVSSSSHVAAYIPVHDPQDNGSGQSAHHSR